MFHSRESLRPLFLIAALLPVACSQQEEVASAEVVVALHHALTSSEVQQVAVEVTASDIAPMVTQLSRSGSQWVGIVGAIPAGAGRSFKVEAKDAAGTVIYEGAASGVNIAANQQAVVSILAQQKAAPVAFENAAPRIDSVIVSTAKPGKGDKVHLTATAHDPNSGDALTYAWTATAGSFANAAALETDWTAPDSAGTQTLTLTVTDPKGAVAAASFSITVVESSAQGTASLSARVNTWPEIQFVRASPPRVDVGQATTLTLSASDADGDSRGFTWSSDCGGTFSNPSVQNPTFTPTSAPASGICTLQVDVQDFRGGTNVGRLGIHVAPALVANFAPSIDLTFQSAASAVGGENVTFRVQASDPEGGPVTVTWSTSGGSVTATELSPGLSEATLTAPACAELATAHITATVSDAQQAKTLKRFDLAINGCPEGLGDTNPTSSCARRKLLVPNAFNGVYFLGTPGAVYTAYCDMSLDGGGWTSFYAGRSGSTNATGSFNAGGTCTQPSSSCRRRLPADLAAATTWIAATCEANGIRHAVKFRVSPGAFALLQNGTASGWQPLLERAALTTNANANLAAEIWTGAEGEPDFIIRGETGTFMASYASNNSHDFCNGIGASGTLQMLMYR